MPEHSIWCTRSETARATNDRFGRSKSDSITNDGFGFVYDPKGDRVVPVGFFYSTSQEMWEFKKFDQSPDHPEAEHCSWENFRMTCNKGEVSVKHENPKMQTLGRRLSGLGTPTYRIQCANGNVSVQKP